MTRHMIEVDPQMTLAQVNVMVQPGCMVDVGPLRLGLAHVQPKCPKRKLDPFDVDSCNRISVFVDGIEVALLVHDFVRDCYYYPTVRFTFGDRDPVGRPLSGTAQGIVDDMPLDLMYKVMDVALQRAALHLTRESGKHALKTPLVKVVSISADDFRISVVDTNDPTASRMRGELSRSVVEVGRRKLFYAGRVSSRALQNALVLARRKSIDATRIAHGLEAKYGTIRA